MMSVEKTALVVQAAVVVSAYHQAAVVQEMSDGSFVPQSDPSNCPVMPESRLFNGTLMHPLQCLH